MSESRSERRSTAGFAAPRGGGSAPPHSAHLHEVRPNPPAEGLRFTITRALGTVVVDASHLTGVDPAAAVIFCQASVWARRRNGSFMVSDPSDVLSSELARAAAATGVTVERWAQPGSWSPGSAVGDA